MSESFVIFEVRKQNNTITPTDMAKVVYKSYNQNDNLLFPHCIGDFIPENDPVRVLDAIVEHLDISAIEATYKGGGASSFAPRMLLKVVLYAYLQNIYSGRKMEKLLKRDVNFMWISGMQRPDYNTINLFRKNRLAGFIDNIFTQVVQMLVDAKFISLEVQYMFYNKELDCYVCPRGQHLDFVKTIKEKSDLGYESTKSVYRAKDCSHCPLRGMCYKGKADRRTIEVNHRNNELRAMAKELLTSEEGLKHRSKRPIEPEAVFGQIKYDNSFKRFHYRGKRLVKAEFATVAVAHNIRKMISNGYGAVVERR